MRASRQGVVLAALVVCLAGQGAGRAQDAPTAEVLRAQDLLEQERRQEEERAHSGKVFIREVVVEGVDLPEDEVKERTAPFEGAWLRGEDIERLIALVRDLCAYSGLEGHSLDITARVRGETLYIGIGFFSE